MQYSFKPITTLKLVILDHSNLYRNYIVAALVAYKRRWNESLAEHILVVTSPSEVPKGIPVIVTNYYYEDLGTLYTKAITVDSLQFLTHHHIRQAVIETTNRYTQCPIQAKEWLASLKPTFAFDCETASKYSDQEIKELYCQITDTPIEELSTKSVDAIQKLTTKHHFDNLADVQDILSQISSNALVAQKNQFTMFSFADNETDSFVIDANEQTTPIVLDFLTTTESTIVIHNSLFDAKLIHWQTKKLPKNIADTQLMWATILNHVDTNKAKVGLKGLAGQVYGKWAVAKDLFGIEHKYSEELIEYAGVDASATMFVYNEALNHPDFQWLPNEHKLPIDQVLPIHHPSELAHRQSRRFFYENVLANLIKPMIQMMNNGIQLDMDKVYQLNTRLDDILAKVSVDLLNNEHIQAFNQHRYKQFHTDFINDRKSKMRLVNDYIKPLDLSKMEHRSYLMEDLRTQYPFDYTPSDQLPNGIPKWSVKEVTHLASILLPSHPMQNYCQWIKDKSISPDHRHALEAMIKLATDKADAYNASYLKDIEDVSIDKLPVFNPGSSPMKVDLFNFLGVECEAETKKGEDSWNVKELERLNKETADPILKDLLSALIAFSQGAIIKRNFVKGFIHYPIDSKLYSSINLMGTKTA